MGISDWEFSEFVNFNDKGKDGEINIDGHAMFQD